MKTTTKILFSALLMPLPMVHLSAQSGCYDLAEVDSIMTALVAGPAPAGASLALNKEGVEIYRRSFGGYSLTEEVHIASATKLLTAACVMTVVDDGLLSLDDMASTYLPNYTGDHGRITIRQALSHTSGLPSLSPILRLTGITLERAVNQIASVPLLASPGTEYRYGGVSFQVAARICEIVTGQDWATLFDARIAQPMGLTATDYTGLAVTQNPRTAGGAKSSLGDFATFMRMLARRGLHLQQGGASVRVLEAASVDAMFRDQTNGVPFVYTPAPAGWRYGLGCFVERVDAQGESLQISSPGAGGFHPWLDFERGLAGVLLVDSDGPAVRPFVEQLVDWVGMEVPFVGVQCYGAATPSCRDATRLRTDGPAIAGNAGFGFTVSSAPPLALGALLLSDVSAGMPLQIFGIDLYVGVLGSPFSVPLSSDSAGDASLPASLANAVPSGPGTAVYAQSLWARGCLQPGALLTASNPLRIGIR